jgi:phospholipase C
LLVASGAALATLSAGTACAAASAPKIGHVFVIVLENEPFDITFGASSPAPYLAHTLPAQGALLTQYFGIGHFSLDNYLALISGQAPNADTQADCSHFADFQATTGKLDAHGQLAGHGCVYPANVPTLANQLTAAKFSWKGYMEGMGSDPNRESGQCGHVPVGSAKDATNHESLNDRYADKHNPFIYFHSIIDDVPYCNANVVALGSLAADLQSVQTTPNYSFITPDLCHDGHNAPCMNGEPGGLVSADAFLRAWVPQIVASPAFRQDGVLIITFDEGTDSQACCNEKGLPDGPKPGGDGPGGGRIGAVMLSPFIKPGTVSNKPYNHYSALRSVETWFGLSFLGYAGDKALNVFGSDVFTQPSGQTAAP